MAGGVPALARRADDALTLTSGEAGVEARCCSAAEEALGADEDEEAAELLLPDEDELAPLECEELPDDLDDESTDDETRRADERVDRGPQLEIKPLAEDETDAEGLAIAGAVLLWGPTCLSRARA